MEIEWDDADKNQLEKDDEAYANKVIDFILSGAEVKFVEFNSEEDVETDRGSTAG